jgi:hypothetical protein
MLKPSKAQRHNVLTTSRAKRIDPYSCSDRRWALKSNTSPPDGMTEDAGGGGSSISSSSRRMGWYSGLAKSLDTKLYSRGTMKVSRRMTTEAAMRAGRRKRVCLRMNGGGLGFDKSGKHNTMDGTHVFFSILASDASSTASTA